MEAVSTFGETRHDSSLTPPCAYVSPSYTVFFQAEFARMVSLASTICGDYQQGEDVAQEAMSRAHRHWDRISTYDRPGAWVRRVTINLSLSATRRLKRELNVLRRIGTENRFDEPATVEPAAESLVLDREVWDAVGQLAPRQRAVIALFYQEDMACADIAEILDCRVSTATSHLNQARRNLAALLGDDSTGTAR